MKVILFCQHSYAFGILMPIAEVLRQKSYEYIWFTTKELEFPFPDEPHTKSIIDLIKFRSDAVYIPGNYVPFYLRGYKVQVFHGLAGEKASHFKVRGYFDVYLTQGPYFTSGFRQLQDKYKNFEVIETGWSKLDIYEKNKEAYLIEKQQLLNSFSANQIIVFAPTHNTSMNAAPFLEEEFERLCIDKRYLVIVKFHDLTKPDVIMRYREMAKNISNMIISDDPNISKLIYIGDLLVSDTSSVVYEFLLLDKPVVTYKSQAGNIIWDDQKNYTELVERVHENLKDDPYKNKRHEIIANYHPYPDGKSSIRMVESIEQLIREKGVPKWRAIGIDRMIETFKMFTIQNW